MGVAQLVEQQSLKLRVVGSSPTTHTMKKNRPRKNLRKIRREYLVEDGAYDGRYRSKIHELKKFKKHKRIEWDED